MSAFRARPPSFLPAMFLSALFAGCGGGGHERYNPSADNARAAVEAALSAWKAGEPHMTVTANDVSVDLYDARRKAGEKLEEYKIIEEVKGGEHPTYRATLRFKGDPREGETTYFVVGIDPLNVFRAEDYKRATGM